MAREPLPGDPRTWTDWRDPTAHGLVKIDCDTALEQVFFGAAVVLAMVAAVVLWDEYVAPLIHSRDAPLFAAAFAPRVVLSLVAGAFVLVGARAATDNFYLIDRARHVVYFHARFFWFRRVRVLLDRADVYAASVESRKRRREDWSLRFAWSTWWEERVVLIDRHGRLVPMSNWGKDALWTANNEAKEIAAALGCQWFESPDDGQLVVRLHAGTPVVSFRPR